MRRKHSTFGKKRNTKMQLSYKKKTRNYTDPEYVKWREIIRKRDGCVCQMPKCNSSIAIKVHHIIRWVDAPSLRFEPRNGICLCRKCHDKITGDVHRWNFTK